MHYCRGPGTYISYEYLRRWRCWYSNIGATCRRLCFIPRCGRSCGPLFSHFKFATLPIVSVKHGCVISLIHTKTTEPPPQCRAYVLIAFFASAGDSNRTVPTPLERPSCPMDTSARSIPPRSKQSRVSPIDLPEVLNRSLRSCHPTENGS